MKRRLILRPEAYADLATAYDWYESKRAGLGSELSAAVLSKIREARLKPNSFPIRHDPNIRRVLVDQFPYAVYFTARDDAVIVLAIFHTSQDHVRRLGDRV